MIPYSKQIWGDRVSFSLLTRIPVLVLYTKDTDHTTQTTLVETSETQRTDWEDNLRVGVVPLRGLTQGK